MLLIDCLLVDHKTRNINAQEELSGSTRRIVKTYEPMSPDIS